MRMPPTEVDSAFISRKADRLVLDGRVSFVRFFGSHLELYWVLGDSLVVYNVIIDSVKQQGTCPCPATGKCSHVVAALKVWAMVNWESPA